ncbi:MAG: hypothetical protein M3518_11045 [Actinomycetota bacterium]|nr:hypothetical protein [Actinomycetota bacterium]
MLLSKGHLDFPRTVVATAGETGHGDAERATPRGFATWRRDISPVGYGPRGRWSDRWRKQCQAGCSSSLLWMDVHRLYPFCVALVAFQMLLVRVANLPIGERAGLEEAAEEQ